MMKEDDGILNRQNLLSDCILRLGANGRNNVGSCCVHVDNGVRTDSTTPNNVGTCRASWEGYNP